jgi:cytidylate kinase
MLAVRLGVPYLDTGAMYRTAALLALRAGVNAPLDASSEERVVQLLDEHSIEVRMGRGVSEVLLDGENVSHAIRSPEGSIMASAVSALSAVRQEMVAIQRRLGEKHGGVVEGRDIGSVVFPDAQLKVFLTASQDERAHRRHRDLQDQEPATSLEEVVRQQHDRDRADASRKDSPLQVARGAVVIDTTEMSPEEVVARLVDELERTRDTEDTELDSNGQDTVRSPNGVS